MAKLVLVPTPIGNLEDITLRALRVLREADVLAAEDTRHSQKLLQHFEIKNRLVSLHKDNEHWRVNHLLDQIESQNQTLAVVTDAGTPGVSDPGFMIVREALARGIEVETLPGATALIPALINSGLPCDRFIFEGFLPVKKGRQTRIQLLALEERTVVFYESPHRLIKTLEQMLPYFGEERKVCVCRELTKLHEENFRGTLQDALAHFQPQPVKGEIVLVVEGCP